MANLDLVGQIQCTIDHVYAVTVTKFSIDGDRPVNYKAGAQGMIGSSVGIERPSGTITFAVPVTGLEFDIVNALDAPGGFTFSFPIGLEQHSVYGCKRSKRGISNDPGQGDSEFTFSFTAAEWIRTK